jgi:hypothetical protein
MSALGPVEAACFRMNNSILMEQQAMKEEPANADIKIFESQKLEGFPIISMCNPIIYSTVFHSYQ